MRYQGERFINQRVRLDGNQFEDCRFTNVVFEYSGGPIHLCGCEFNGFGWDFGGELARGLAVLGQLYATSQPTALALLAKAMFPKAPVASGAPPRPHPSLEALFAAAERDDEDGTVRDTGNVENLDYSRLRRAIKRKSMLARAA